VNSFDRIPSASFKSVGLLAAITFLPWGVIYPIITMLHFTFDHLESCCRSVGTLQTTCSPIFLLFSNPHNLILGSASLDAKLNGKIALRTMGYFVTTSFFNAILGVILAVAIHPGNPSIRGQLVSGLKLDERRNTLLDNFLDLGRYSNYL